MKITKFISLFLSLVVLVSMTACSSGADTNDDLLDIGDYVAKYKGCEIVKDDYNKDTVIVTFDYTNNSDEAASFLFSIYYKVKQGDTELESGTIIDDETFESVFDTEMAQVEPGQTAEVKLAYNLSDLTTDVVIEASDLMEDNSDAITIKIAE